MAYQSEIEKLEARFEEKPEQWFAALADAYRKNKDLDLALDIVDQWLAKRPNYTSGHIVRGRVLLDRGDDAPAREAFERVLELDAENIIAIRSLSEISERAGDVGAARDWLKRLLEVDPMNEDAEQALAKLEPAPEVAEVAEAAGEAQEAQEAQEAATTGQVSGFEATSFDESAAAAGGGVEEEEGFVIERASRSDLEATVPTEGFAVDESPQLGEPDAGDEPLDMDVGEVERATDDFLPDADRAGTPDDTGVLAGDWREDEAASAADDERAIGGDLPLILPDEVAPESEAESELEEEPVPAADEPPETSVEPEPVVTETMAELYMRQGHVDEARDIFRRLADQRPDDPRLRQRVEQLEDQLAGAPAAASQGGPHNRYAAAHTGGLSARAYLRGILTGTAGAEGARGAGALGGGAGGPAASSPMDDAFADEPPGEPTRQAADDVSLASVFGDEPEPSAPAAPPAPSAPGGKGEGEFSFDEFFGGAKPDPPEEPPPGAAESGSPPSGGPKPPRRDDDFRSWLKGLRT